MKLVYAPGYDMSSGAPTKRALFYGWLLATLLSGIPSTLYGWISGGDALAFRPQFADHLIWGACYSVGLSLARPSATRP